ncbi:hypothetical protein Bca4012_026630 [Brassica carinata]
MLLQYGDAASILALPLPTPAANGDRTGRKSPMTVDSFAVSLEVAPPPYVQMNDMENKQRLLMEEQMMWNQYTVNGRQGHELHASPTITFSSPILNGTLFLHTSLLKHK